MNHISNTQNISKIDRPTGQVGQYISKIGESITNLEARMEQLGNRLNGVLRNTPPSGPTDVKTEAPRQTLVGVAEQLYSINERIEQQSARVALIQELLEL